MNLLTLFILTIGLLLLRTNILVRRVERAAPPTGCYQCVSGEQIHYVACGPEQAQPVTLVHGLAGNLNHFT